jgi:hypothetical protein
MWYVSMYLSLYLSMHLPMYVLIFLCVYESIGDLNIRDSEVSSSNNTLGIYLSIYQPI